MKKIILLIACLFACSSMAYAVNPDDYIFQEFINSKQGKTWTDPTTGMEFVWVPGGCYNMGSNNGDSDEKPVHEVCVDGFWMGKYEVTNSQFRQFAPNHNSGSYKGHNLNQEQCPVVRVSWKEAQAFGAWMSSHDQGNFRLPTEGEWEYAARLGNKKHITPANAQIASVPVDSQPANALGLYGMEGNVKELCQDVYDTSAYSKLKQKNPVYKNFMKGYTSIRGASWSDPASTLTTRSKLSIKKVNPVIGFRLVKIQD